MKRSGDWVSNAGFMFGQGGPLSVDSSGYVQSLNSTNDQRALTYIFENSADLSARHYGRYVLTWQGEGQFAPAYGNFTTLSSQPGRLVFDWTGGSSLAIEIRQINPRNYPKNIKLYLLADEATLTTQPYNETFLAGLRGLDVVRFMNYLHTNNSEAKEWANRAKPTDRTQSSARGGCIEGMVGIANAVNADMWYNIPQAATNEYVIESAKLIKSLLKPRLKIYLEYGNEMWNAIFSGNAYCVQQENQLGLGSAFGMNFYSKRSKEIWDLFKAQFSEASNVGRVKAVVGTQLANAGITWIIMQYQNNGKAADYVAFAPYFSGSWSDPANGGLLTRSDSQLLQQCRDDWQATIRNLVTPQKQWLATNYPNAIPLYYEGGLDFDKTNFPSESQAAALTRAYNLSISPAFEQLYKDYINELLDTCPPLFVHYKYVSQPDRFLWGLRTYTVPASLQEARYRAIRSLSHQPERQADETKLAGS
jgi:hypothetical protein